MDINDDDDDDLGSRIKHFLAKHTNFRDPAFDPAPYLIKVLKEKEANQELLVQKQTELVQLENQAQELVEEVTIDHCQQFMELLKIPQEYGQQLQGLKQNMANVKRKVKQTKTLLMQTQKDIKQIHLNCVFNKLVYRRLKQVQLKINQYQTASLALKNHLYLDCAQNLPSFSGTSVLQGALAARTENLKLRFLHQAIQEVRLFLYFTPRLTLPTAQMFFDRLEERQEIFNQTLHLSFYRRYQLFKKADCLQYLSSIWSLQGLEERTGRVAIIHDIIKGIIRIGKSSEITESLCLDVRKSVANVYQVLAYFFSKDPMGEPQTKQRIWFTSYSPAKHNTFLSVLFCVGAALLRKMLIVRKLCSQYQLSEVTRKLSSEEVLQMIRDEIVQLVRLAYFTENSPIGGQVQTFSQDLRGKLKQIRGFIYWPYFRMLIQNSFQILCQQLSNIQEKIFSLSLKDCEYYVKAFQPFHQKFLTLFHQEFMKQIQGVFPQGRGFNPQSLDSILSQREYSKVDIQFCSKYCSQDRKSLRQFFDLVSFLNSLKQYFSHNFEPIKYRQYSLLLVLFFYLKLNYTLYRYIISPTQFDKALEARLKDPKLKNKEKHTSSLYQNIIKPREQAKPRNQKKYFKNQQGADHPQMRSIEQLKLIRVHTDMLFFYFSQRADHLQEIKSSPDIDKYQSQVQKHEPSNYDENVNSKLMRIWEQLVRPQEATLLSLDGLLCAVYRRMLEMYFIVSACLYTETGAY